MLDSILSPIQLLLDRLGIQPAALAALALVLLLLLAFLALYLNARLRLATAMVHRLAERLGHAPSDGDGLEIFQQDLILRGKEVAADKLEERVRELEAEIAAERAALQPLRERSKELEDRTGQTDRQHEEAEAQATEAARAHQFAVEEFELRVRNLQTDCDARGTSLQALHARCDELEAQLRLATAETESTRAQADQAGQVHRATVEEQALLSRELAAEGTAKDQRLQDLQLQVKALEGQLEAAAADQQAALAKVDEDAQARRAPIEEIEAQVRGLRLESDEKGLVLQNLNARCEELEGQLLCAANENTEVQEEAQLTFEAHRAEVEALELKLSELAQESAAKDANLQQIELQLKTLEERLEQAAAENEAAAAKAGEAAQAYQSTVGELEQRLNNLLGASEAKDANLQTLEGRCEALEGELRKASVANETTSTQAAQAAQAHDAAIEQLEKRICNLQSEGEEKDARLEAHQQRNEALESRLREVALANEAAVAQAGETALADRLAVEELQMRVRNLQSEGEEKDASLGVLEVRCLGLEEELRQASAQKAESGTTVVPSQALAVQRADDAEQLSELLYRRAEWTVARAVGGVRSLGLVAAEAYASAAVAADPESRQAHDLLAEVELLLNSAPQSRHSASLAITTFEQQASQLFECDPSAAGDKAEEEALQRYRAGLGPSALPVADLALAMRLQSAGEESPRTLAAQSLRAALLARVGREAEALAIARKVAEMRTAHPELGATHPRTLVSHSQVAEILFKLGRRAEALPIAQFVSSARTADPSLGPHHPLTLTSRLLAARILAGLGREGEALPLAQATANAMAAHPEMGARNPHTQACRELIKQLNVNRLRAV